MPRLKAFNVAIVSAIAQHFICSRRLPHKFQLKFRRSWLFGQPSVVPAVFAVLFGPWVGGIGAALGIFVRDIFVHWKPLLSLIAGVTSNFIRFFLIGYFAHKKLNLKQTLAG